MTYVSTRSAVPVPQELRFNSPNTVRVAKLNNDSIDRANAYDIDDNPAPIEDTDAVVTFTVFENGRTDPFPDYDAVPLVWTPAVGDEPGCYKADLDATADVPVGQYYGEYTVTMPGKSPARLRCVVTVSY
jgi:hypothetical protein